ncbi:MAG: nuclear transport factor 2 family protein [Acidimicrobiia bacterium]
MNIDEWVESYRLAWEQSDDESVAALFTENATYRSNIFEEPHVGREGIRAYWRQATETQSDTSVRMGRPFGEGNRVAVEFWTTMDNEGAPVSLPGCLLLQFEPDGRCASLREYWHFAGGRLEPPAEWGT